MLALQGKILGEKYRTPSDNLCEKTNSMRCLFYLGLKW